MNLSIYDIRTEYMTDPIGVDSQNPRFTWKLMSDHFGVKQTSYQILVWDAVSKEILWNSGIVSDSNQTSKQRVVYSGKRLESMQQVQYRILVTACDDAGAELTAEGIGTFAMGLLHDSDWKCRWIEPEDDINTDEPQPVQLLRKTFEVKKNLKTAYVFETAHGLYENWMNGHPVTEDKFKPGFTSYYNRLQYQMYDITAFLTTGENVWSAALGDGWWRGTCGGSMRNNFGTKTAYFGQICLIYEDGTREWVITDSSFVRKDGDIRVSDMFMGDIVDARLGLSCENNICFRETDANGNQNANGREWMNWKENGFDDTGWEHVHEITDPYSAKLIAGSSVPVREKEKLIPKVMHDQKGRLVLDFGQNIAGYVDMTLRHTKEGQVIHLTHGEDLDPSGNFSMENIRQLGAAKLPHFQEVIYTCKGAEKEHYCPMFSVFGFRYVLLEGYDESEILAGDFIAKAVYSDMEQTGDFTCSNELINRLVKNSRWSQKGNYLDVAVDCPTRERNTWTGDNQIYVKTAADFMDVYAFYEKWLQDQAAEQYENGKVSITFPCTSSPHLADTYEKLKKDNPMTFMAGPAGTGSPGEDCAGWGDAAAYIPYIIYLTYGDEQILKNQYQCAKKWVDYMLCCAKEHNECYKDEPQYHTYGKDGILDAEFIYDTRMHYGEWQEPMQNQGEVQVTPELIHELMRRGKPKVATAYMCRSAENVSAMAEVLGLTKEAEYYRNTADRIRGVYETYLIDEDGTIEKGHQAAYVRALAMNLCSGTKKKFVEQQLVQEVVDNNFKLNTGFLSTPFLLQTLTDIGRSDLAFRLLEEKDAPSWLHPVLLGATTIAEGWYSFDNFTDSHNHYAFGAVCDFLFSYIAGIRPVWNAAGYREFELRPMAGGSLTSACGRLESPFGMIVSEWREIDDRSYHYHCEIPVNTKAYLYTQNGDKKILGSGSYDFIFEQYAMKPTIKELDPVRKGNNKCLQKR